MSIGSKSKNTNHNEKIQIKLEVDTDPPTKFRVENRIVLNPVSFYVLTLPLSDLFAGKMHATLYRAWRGRVKGRDWYDLIWYLQRKTPLSLNYLRECMRQAGNLGQNEPLDRNQVLQLLRAKIDEVDWKSARDDMTNFIADPARLDIWSPHYFHQIIDHLVVEPETLL